MKKKRNEDLWGRICRSSALWGRILPYIEWEGFVGKDLSGRIVLHFGGRKLDSSPCGEEFAGKDSFALQGEESLTPSPCGEGFVGRDRCAFRGEEKV